MYDYLTPKGVGDQFFIYVLDGNAYGLVNGNDYQLLAVAIQDGDFVLRAYAGADTVLAYPPDVAAVADAGTIQLYDTIGRGFYSPVATLLPASSPSGQCLVPETIYRENGFLRVDLTGVNLAENASGDVDDCPYGQLCFYGVRRIRGAVSDPAPSYYKYYEKPFSFSKTFTINTPGSTVAGQLASPDQYTVGIDDYDFELRRMECVEVNAPSFNPNSTAFAMTLYNQSWRKTSNYPVNAGRWFHNGKSTVQGYNNWPSPPMLYPVNTVIRFDIYSQTTTSGLPLVFTITFHGVRRIPCS